LSRSGWLGLAAAIGLYTLIAADAKIRKFILGAAFILSLVVIFTPNLRYRFLLPFYGEKSAVSRLSLWQTGVKGIKESPIFGLGLKGFATKWDNLNTDPNLEEKHNLPHNLFLNLWVETGLLGILSFLGIIITSLYIGLKEKTDPYKLGIVLFLTAFLVQGQIDNPYFKNDLALVFWLILSFLF
jgi:O-antigen ligase